MYRPELLLPLTFFFLLRLFCVLWLLPYALRKKISKKKAYIKQEVMTSLLSSACFSSLNSACNFLIERAFCVFFIRSSQFLVLTPAWRCERLGQGVSRGIADGMSITQLVSSVLSMACQIHVRLTWKQGAT